MKYYLAGPMTNKPDHNWPLFRRVTDFLRQRGYVMVCPTECGGSQQEDYTKNLKLSLIGMLQCDAIILLPGWLVSRGATLELLLATLLGYKVLEADIHESETIFDVGLWKKDYTTTYILKAFLHNNFNRAVLFDEEDGS